jgi:hypothetical protein
MQIRIREVTMDRSNRQEDKWPQMGRRLVCIAVLAVIFLLALSGLAYADVWTDISDATWQNVYHVSATEAFTVAQGYPDGTFRPDQAVTRGQFAKMVADGLDIPLYNPAIPTFSDVSPDHIFYQYIEGAHADGVIYGYPDGTFRPGDNIARQQTNSILGLWLSQQEIAQLGGIQGAHGFYSSLALWFAAEGEAVLSQFADGPQVQPVHRPATAYLIMRGVVMGSFSGGATYLKPASDLTRAQAVTMILRTRAVVFERTVLHLHVTGISDPIGAGTASSVTVTVLDPSNAVVTGYTGTIHFTSTDPYPAVLPANYTFTSLDAGTHTFTGGVTLKTAGSQTVSATDTVTSTITGAETVTVTAGTATKLFIENAATAAGIPIDATTVAAGSHIDVYANSHDQYDNFVANVAATWSLSNLVPATGGVVAGDLVPASGSKSAVFTGHLVGTCKINAAATGLTKGITGTITVAGGAGVVSAARSTVTALPASVPADGATLSTITVTLKDANGDPVAGKTVALAKTGGPGTPTISPASGASNASGVVTFTVKSTMAGADVFTATDTTDTIVITQTATVTFTPGVVSATHSTVTASPASVHADGRASSTITVTLKDANGDPVAGKTVALEQTGGPGTPSISPASGVSNASGVVTFKVRSTTTGADVFTATDTTDAIVITQTATVTFVASPRR